MSKVNFTLAVNGNNQITNQLFSEDFNIDKKFEYEFSDLTSNDSYIFLPIDKINPINKILTNSDSQFKIKILCTSGETENFISGVTYMSLDPFYASTISGLAIGTDNLSPVNGFISLLRLV